MKTGSTTQIQMLMNGMVATGKRHLRLGKSGKKVNGKRVVKAIPGYPVPGINSINN